MATKPDRHLHSDPPTGGAVEQSGVPAWRREAMSVSLPEVHGSIAVPRDLSFWKKMWAFAGPGFLVAVGYMDPGNWATDLAGGAKFGYTLLFVIMLSNLMAILLQHLCIKLGVATGRDLAQACRDHYSEADGVVPLDPVRDGHRRLRSGGGRRLGHRAATALRHSAGVGLPASRRWTCSRCSTCRTRDFATWRRWWSR